MTRQIKILSHSPFDLHSERPKRLWIVANAWTNMEKTFNSLFVVFKETWTSKVGCYIPVPERKSGTTPFINIKRKFNCYSATSFGPNEHDLLHLHNISFMGTVLSAEPNSVLLFHSNNELEHHKLHIKPQGAIWCVNSMSWLCFVLCCLD